MILLLATPAFGQWTIGSRAFPQGVTLTSMIRDTTVTPCDANTGGTVTSINCSLGSVPAGDTIICNSEYGDDSPSAKFSDNINGLYNIVAYGVSGNGGYHEFLGTWYFANTASGSTTVTMTYSIGVNASGFSCYAAKNGATSNAVDAAFFGWNDNGTSATSQTLSSSPTPTNNGELLACALSTGTTTDTVTATNGSYTIIEADATDALYPMYWGQSTKTAGNCPYTVSPADSATSLGTAFLSSTGTGGVTPYQGFIETFAGTTNGSVPACAGLAAGASGNVPGWFGNELDCFPNSGAGNFFAVTNTHSDLTASTSGPTNLLSSTLYLPANSQGPSGSTSSYTSFQTYTGNSSLNLQLATGTSGDGVKLDIVPTQSTLSWGYYLEWTIPNTDTSTNSYILGGAQAGTDYLYLELKPNGTTMTAEMTGYGGATTSLGTVSSSTAYWVTEQFNEGGTDSAAIYSGCPGACTLVGSNTITDSGSTPISFYYIGSTSGTQSSGYDIWWRNVKFCPNNTYPCMP
jgi:hypothetical protein